MRVKSRPYNGGMNTDDSLENMPIDDYESLKNMTIKKGTNFLEKLDGTVALPGSLSGNCFGWFAFPDYSVLFLDDSGTHSVHLLYPDDTVETIMGKVVFDLDTSVQLVNCILVNNSMFVFNNGVDEVHKLHIDMARLWVEFYEFDDRSGYKNITLSEQAGKVVFNCVEGFTAGTTRVLTVGNEFGFSSNAVSMLFHNPLVGKVINGYLLDANTFITELDAIGDVVAIYSAWEFQISETSITSIDIPYRGCIQTTDNPSLNDDQFLARRWQRPLSPMKMIIASS